MDCHFQRIDGDAAEGAVYFLPWRTGFSMARWAGLIPSHGLGACYRLATDIISPDPEICAARMGELVSDALSRQTIRPRFIVGYSLGTVPATIMAARLGVPLWSFASADRGGRMIWSSPAARSIRLQAEQMGFSRTDFSNALRHLDPIECLSDVHSDSRIVIGRYDNIVPMARSKKLIECARKYLHGRNILQLPLGRLGVLAAGPWLQRYWSSRRIAEN
jgi:hypothetical protein